MFIIAIIMGVLGGIISAIGNGSKSPLTSLCGGIMMLCSGILFLLNVFM